MLKQRILTALVLLALLLPALWVDSPWPFALLSLAFIGAAGWEWFRLNQAGSVASVLLGLMLVVACGWALSIGWNERAPDWTWWLAAALWVPGGAWALRAGPACWPLLSGLSRCLIGLVALSLAWLGLAHARTIGVNFLLSLLCLVWAADIGAYFGGRAFGRHKLAPSISPGKSWEGVWSGMIGVLLLAPLWMFLDTRMPFDSPSLYTLLAGSIGWPGLVLALLFLCGMSVVGDLIESLVKRSAGAKDSGRLLPGHGGVLDRVDALLPVVPIALALLTL